MGRGGELVVVSERTVRIEGAEGGRRNGGLTRVGDRGDEGVMGMVWMRWSVG